MFDRKFSVDERPDVTIVCFRYLEQLAALYGNDTSVLPICPNKRHVFYAKVDL